MLIELTNPTDGFAFQVLHLQAQLVRRGGVILLQEIFGIDQHMRADAARWAQLGFEVMAPSLFDRVEYGFVAEHDSAGIERGFANLKKTADTTALGDINACITALSKRGPVFIVGYCYGGRLAWLAAGRESGLAAVAVYYGNVLTAAEGNRQCPVICHFGALDTHLPVKEIVTMLHTRHPKVPVYVYDQSGHGFNNQDLPAGNATDAALARQRTLELFAAHTAA